MKSTSGCILYDSQTHQKRYMSHMEQFLAYQDSLFSKKQPDCDSVSEAQESTAASFRTTVTAIVKNNEPSQVSQRSQIESFEK